MHTLYHVIKNTYQSFETTANIKLWNMQNFNRAFKIKLTGELTSKSCYISIKWILTLPFSPLFN